MCVLDCSTVCEKLDMFHKPLSLWGRLEDCTERVVFHSVRQNTLKAKIEPLYPKPMKTKTFVFGFVQVWFSLSHLVKRGNTIMIMNLYLLSSKI